MKRCTRVPIAFQLLLFAVCVVGGGRVRAQAFRTLHSFTNGADGALPQASLILSGNGLFGAAQLGGEFGNGTIYKLNTDGSGFTILHTFPALSNGLESSDGANPYGGLTLSGNTLYGAAHAGGSFGNGTIFRLNTDGSAYSNLYSFSAATGQVPFITNSDGANPSAGVVVSQNTLYGTTPQGGTFANGTIYKINTDGDGFTTLHSFTKSSGSGLLTTNSDGAGPQASLTLSGNTLYGTAYGGGICGYGTVFSVGTDGSNFTTLYSFSGLADGGNPGCGLVLVGNTLYGMAALGGNAGNGTVFSVQTNGGNFRVLHSFLPLTPGYPLTNSDGANPWLGGLICSGGFLYGTVSNGGDSGNGTIFALRNDGTEFLTLHSFTGGLDGANSYAALIPGQNALYGTAFHGGSSGFWGTVFSLSFEPLLTLVPFTSNIVLAWPTNFAGFDYGGYNLESVSNLGPSAVWTTNLPAPAIENGQYMVTNPVSGQQQFFRLAR